MQRLGEGRDCCDLARYAAQDQTGSTLFPVNRKAFCFASQKIIHQDETANLYCTVKVAEI